MGGVVALRHSFRKTCRRDGCLRADHGGGGRFVCPALGPAPLASETEGLGTAEVDKDYAAPSGALPHVQALAFASEILDSLWPGAAAGFLWAPL